MRAGPCVFLTNCREQKQVEGCADETVGLGFENETAYKRRAKEEIKAAPSD